MTQNRLSTSGTASLEGVLALAITVTCVLPVHRLLADVSEGRNTSIHFIDAAFGVLFVLGWKYCFKTFKNYSRFSSTLGRMVAMGKGTVLMIAPVIAYMAGFHRSDLTVRRISTLFLALYLFELSSLFVREYLIDRLAKRDPRRAIIVGSGRRAGKAWREIRTRYHSSITLLGFIDDRSSDEMAPEIAKLHIGTIDQLADALLKNIVDVVLIAMPIKSCYEQMQHAVEIAESVGVDVICLGDVYRVSKRSADQSQDIFMELAPQQEHFLLQRIVKRTVDVVFAAIGLVVLAPVLSLIAIGVKLTSPGPVLFWQQRYGYRRRLFNMCKFRSMVPDAETILARYEHLNEADGPIFKIKNDPRVTPFGKFLRSTSLDELPQLWNVLCGEMSMVGPRPMSVRDVSLFRDASYMRRFSVKAGMTGLWQVSGRSQTGFNEWMALDVRYIESWSLSMDFQILFRTVGAVLKRSGAM